jgi:hypothetical protein
MEASCKKIGISAKKAFLKAKGDTAKRGDVPRHILPNINHPH